MIAGKRVIGIITARGGSKGLPRKNVLPVGGRPMLEWSVIAGRQSTILDRLILSSDDAEIIDTARKAGCDVPFIRPAHLATDTAKVGDALLHALDNVGEHYDIAVMLPATSPLRIAEDIDGALAEFVRHDCPSLVSVARPAKSPYWMYRVDERSRMRPMLDGDAAYRRQELPPVFVLNGAIYVVRVDWFRQVQRFVDDETCAYVMPEQRSVDVDGELDMLVADILLKCRQAAKLEKLNELDP